MKEFWDERYSKPDYAYGRDPNEFFKKQIGLLPVGKILMPAEGEGRNAVYAAQLGWQVEAFDQSAEGRVKALELAKEKGVSIAYQVGNLNDLSLPDDSFNAIGLIYAHFSAEIKSSYHTHLIKTLKKGGIVIFEAFSKKHLDYKKSNPTVGGPDSLAMLFSIDEIESDFRDFEVIELLEQEINLSEGTFHIGTGSVIRFVGKKR